MAPLVKGRILSHRIGRWLIFLACDEACVASLPTQFAVTHAVTNGIKLAADWCHELGASSSLFLFYALVVFDLAHDVFVIGGAMPALEHW